MHALERRNERLLGLVNLVLGNLPILIELAPVDDFEPPARLFPLQSGELIALLGKRFFHLSDDIGSPGNAGFAAAAKGLARRTQRFQSEKNRRDERKNNGGEQKSPRFCQIGKHEARILGAYHRAVKANL
nr:oxidoreductase [uncultured bacterium]